MPNPTFTIYLDNISTTANPVSGGAAIIKNLAGTTIDVQAINAVNDSFVSSQLNYASTYTITLTGAAGAPAGTFYLYTNQTDINYIVSVPMNGVTATTAPATAALPSPNPNIENCWIVFMNSSTGTPLPAGITATISISGGGVVDTQVTNALGQITSTKLAFAPIYTVTFTGGGAPVGTFILDPIGGNILNPCVV